MKREERGKFAIYSYIIYDRGVFPHRELSVVRGVKAEEKLMYYADYYDRRFQFARWPRGAR